MERRSIYPLISLLKLALDQGKSRKMKGKLGNSLGRVLIQKFFKSFNAIIFLCGNYLISSTICSLCPHLTKNQPLFGASCLMKKSWVGKENNRKMIPLKAQPSLKFLPKISPSQRKLRPGSENRLNLNLISRDRVKKRLTNITDITSSLRSQEETSSQTFSGLSSDT